MFWISAGSIIIIFFSSRSYMNNKFRWQNRKFHLQSSRIYFWLLQVGNILLIIAGLLFLMLAIVCHVKGLELLFSSEYAYHMQLIGN
jgi:hypothetical protein